MGEQKCSFILYGEYEEMIAMLSDEECGRLFRAIFNYERTGDVPDDMTMAMKIVFIVIRNRLDENREKYRIRCERMRENGKKGGRPKSSDGDENQDKPKESNCFTEKPKETNRKQSKAKKADTDTDTDTDTLSPSERARESKTRKKTAGSFDTDETLLCALNRTYGVKS